MYAAVGRWGKSTSGVVGEVVNKMLESRSRCICSVRPDGEFTETVLLTLSEAVPLCKTENLTAKGLPLRSLLIQLPVFMKFGCLEL